MDVREHQTDPHPVSQQATPDYRDIFRACPGMHMILDPDFRIVDVSDGYARTAGVRREDIVGRNVFDAFPDNPDAPEARSVENLSASLHRVLQSRKLDAMPAQRYDTRPITADGAEAPFTERYWRPVNIPVLNAAGEVQWIMQQVEEITEQVQRSHAPLRHVPAGGTIFEQGGPSDRSYTIISGWAALCQMSRDGRLSILRFALPGDLLPFERHSPVRTFGAIAVGDVTACSFSRSRQERLERDYPGFDARHKEIASRDLEVAYEGLANIAVRSARERVAHLLWGLARRSLSRRPRPDDRIFIPANQIQLALATGLTPVHMSRTLRSLREASLLDFEEHQLTIHDPFQVEELAGGPSSIGRRWT